MIFWSCRDSTYSSNAGSKVKGLTELLTSLNLVEYLGAAGAWCVKQGAGEVADLKGKTYAEDLAEELKLEPIKKDKLVMAIKQA